MKAKGHLETFNHFSIIALDAALFRSSWETAFGVQVPEIFPSSGDSKDDGGNVDMSHFFTRMPTYRGGMWPAGKYYGVEQVSVPPLYQPENRMIEVKAAGTLPSVTEFYDKYGNGIQYLGIVEGDNRDAFLDALRESYGCEKLEEMFYDPLPGDFCIVETEPVLGFNLCVKQDGALNGLVQVILPETAECSIVVPDLETAVRDWSNIFEIKTPKIQTVKQTCTVRGAQVEAEFRAARIDETPFTLYLVENKEVGPFAEFSQKNGAGIHHICFALGEDGAAFRERLQSELGIGVLAEYELDGVHYTVFDSIEKMGAYIAIC